MSGKAATSPRDDASCQNTPLFHNLRQLPRSVIPRILQEMKSLERKAFASHEALPFDDRVLQQRNMEVVVGLSDQARCSPVVAYAVAVKWNHRLLLHKKVIEDSKCWSCRAIDLWVDESNLIAQCLYSKCGFVVQEIVNDYYSPALPELAFPLNSQIPPVAYVSQPYNFAFSANTFTSSVPQISYTITHGPKWLGLDSGSRQFRGIPTPSDVGTTTLQLVASDSTGQLSTSVTFVVVGSPTLKLNSPLLPQLEQSNLISPPNSLLAHPQQPFHVGFGRHIFSGATFGTKYYAVSADNTPLPPWVQFDESLLEFSGTTPALVSPLAGSQTYGLRLIASNVPGFAELTIDFQIVISRRILAFSTASQNVQVSTGAHFQTLPLRPLITLDGGPVTDDQILNIEASVPAWAKLDREQLSLSGTSDGSASTTVTITVTDIYQDVANATVFLENTGASSVPLGIIGIVNVTAGEYFSYNEITPSSSPWVRAIAALGNASAWLNFNPQTWALSGLVPQNLSPQTLSVSITFANASTDGEGRKEKPTNPQSQRAPNMPVDIQMDRLTNQH
ncbi:hypothetical protein CLAIMM_07271 [Cladophialophora immunda]|nr:hypothetical protein CLAIMM_07271 [Cladophialophora immunda]